MKSLITGKETKQDYHNLHIQAKIR